MTVREELLAAGDETIEDAVRHAQPLVLRGLLYLLTGDEEVVAMKPGMASKFLGGGEMANEADVDALRAKAAAFLKDYRDRGAGEIPAPSADRIARSVALTAGQDIPPQDEAIWMEEAALDPWARGVTWRGGAAPKASEDFMVAVIGAGLSGLNTAVQLKRAGIPFVLFEKNPEVGDSWFENRYPGARVDTASRGYTHLFGVSYPFTSAYATRDENLSYLKWVADHFGLREHIVFSTETKSIVWDDEAKAWTVTGDGPDGTRTWRANAVITCVGFLSRPQLPQIDGLEHFGGVACHTAAWPDGVTVDGKRVAVVGSAASGYQTFPVIAKTAAHATLFQRTASWCFEDPAYVKPLSAQAKWLDRNFPFYPNFVRLRLAALTNPEIAKLGRVDPSFDDPHAVSAGNKFMRDNRIAYLNKKLSSRPDLIDKMTPTSPPMASRPIRIDADDSVYDALLRDNTALVTDPIERITTGGVVAGGQEHPVDIIAFATGFRANDFLWPMEVRGRGGVRIEEVWAKDGPRGYLGAMVPGFPNLFMCYGPNTNNFGGFLVIDLLELVAQFALRAIAGLIEQNKSAVEVSEEAYWRFAAELDREEKYMVYMDKRASNYYQTGGGRSAVNGPIDIRRMWRWLRDPAGPAPAQADAGMRPHFGADLVVR